MRKEITWTTGAGKKATVTVELKTKETLFSDGWNSEVSCCKMEILAEVEGMGCIGTGRPMKTGQAAAPWKIGKLGLIPANAEKVFAAIAEVEATPEWQAKIENEKKAEEESREYEAHRAKMKKIMGY
jgi:hypothetical protein